MVRIAGDANCNTRRIQIISIVFGTAPDPIYRAGNLQHEAFPASPVQVSAVGLVESRRGFDPISSNGITATIS